MSKKQVLSHSYQPRNCVLLQSVGSILFQPHVSMDFVVRPLPLMMQAPLTCVSILVAILNLLGHWSPCD